MKNARRLLSISLVATTFVAGLAAATPASALGRGGWRHGGGWGGGGFRPGWGGGGFRPGWGGGFRPGWGYPGYGYGWGYPGYGYGAGIAGAALGAAAIGAIAAGAAQQNQYYYAAPRATYGSVSTRRSRHAHSCIRTEWDPMQGYVHVQAPCY